MRHTILLLMFVLLPACGFGLRADINGDGRVDLLDFAILAAEWLMEVDMSYPDTVTASGTFLTYANTDEPIEFTQDGVEGDYPKWTATTEGVEGDIALRIYYGVVAEQWLLVISEDGNPELDSWFYGGPESPASPVGEYTDNDDGPTTATVTAVSSAELNSLASPGGNSLASLDPNTLANANGNSLANANGNSLAAADGNTLGAS